MAAGAVDFLRGLMGWWSGEGSSVTPPDTVDIAYKAGDKQLYYKADNRVFWTAGNSTFWKAEQ